MERYVTIITNVALLVGLILVIVELRQSREEIAMSRELTLAEITANNTMAIASDAELSRLVAKAWSNEVDDFTPGQHMQMRHYVFASTELHIAYYYMRDSDFSNKEDWCTFIGVYERFYSHEYFGLILNTSSYAEKIMFEYKERCKGDI